MLEKDLLIESPLAITGLFFGRRKNLKKYNKINNPDIFKHYFKENLKKYNIDNAISNAYNARHRNCRTIRKRSKFN